MGKSHFRTEPAQAGSYVTRCEHGMSFALGESGGQMDLPRHIDLKKKRTKRVIISVTGAILVLALTLGLARLKPAAPSVEKATVWIDTVKQGEMVRQVRGTGTLVPEVI